MSFHQIMRSTKLFLTKNSPTILTCVSIFGVISTVVTAYRGTVHAQDILYAEHIPRDFKEEMKVTWKCYIPTAISTALTIACIIGSHHASLRQKEALSSAYLLSQATLQEYQKKVIERIGVNKERELRDEAIKEVANRQSPIANYICDAKEAIHTGHGNTLVFDVATGDYFRSELNYLKSTFISINDKLVKGVEEYYTQNEIRFDIGLPYIPVGEYAAIDVDHLIDIDTIFVPELMDNGEVKVNMELKLYPISEIKRR